MSGQTHIMECQGHILRICFATPDAHPLAIPTNPRSTISMLIVTISRLLVKSLDKKHMSAAAQQFERGFAASM